MGSQVLAINPGSTSTKIAWYRDDEEAWRVTLSHCVEEVAAFPCVAEQFPFRLRVIEQAVAEEGGDLDALQAVVGRGGIVDSIPGGTYAVDELLLNHLRRGKPWEHASNLGGILAAAIAFPRKIPAYIVDPVAVDELEAVARVTGLPELPKHSLGHALNIKATVRRAAKDLGRDWRKMNVVVAHLGGGISICTHKAGRMVDLNNANEFGPFSPERSGGVPAGDLVRLCFSGNHTMQDLRKKIAGAGGVAGYLGTSDLREVKRRIAEGDEKARLVYEAMAYQVAKEVGAYAVPLEGGVEAILLTGGVAHDGEFVRLVTEQVQWIAPVLVYPGEDEMRALVEGALRVLRGEEPCLRYGEMIAAS